MKHSLLWKPRSIVPALLVTLISAACLRANSTYTVEYPQGYRKWTHVMSYVIGPQAPGYEKNGGLHHFYANDKAVEGYRTGKFPDGSMLVDERNKAEEKSGKTTGGDWIGIGVMVKDSQRYAETGGWGFEVFTAGNPTNGWLTTDSRQGCFNCHAKQKDRDFVFSQLRK
jgi:hypothetical protein